MSREALTVLIAKDADGATTLRAPKLGLWSDHPRDGALVSPGSDVGTLTQLNRRYALVIPDGVAGRVAIAGRQWNFRVSRRLRPDPLESGRAFLGRGGSYGENSEAGGPWC